MKKYAVLPCVYLLIFAVLLTSCGKDDAADYDISNGAVAEATQTTEENTIEDETTEDAATEEEGTEAQEAFVPTRENVLAAREAVLQGMTQEEIDRLTENIKVANQTMENAYLNQNIFEKLEDEDSFYWNYFDEKGDIQIGWAYDGENSEMKNIMETENLSRDEFYEKYGEPVLGYNRFDADNFIELIEDMQQSVENEALRNDLQTIIEETQLAKETHEMVHANNIYKILHDMDYFLLRYGPEDVGVFTPDSSLVRTYYGTLSVYNH